MSTYEELIAQRQELDRQIEAAHRAEKVAAIETVRRLVGQFQLSADECGFKPQKNNSPTRQKRGAPVKFRGPNGEVWTGRGRTPGWLAALEGQGGSREKFRVDA